MSEIMNTKAIRQLITKMQPPLDRNDKEEWMIEKAVEIGYMLAISELNLSLKKHW